ncbi:MAG TPA: alpha/beta hydrolase [Rubrobacter sp.]
MLEIELSAGTIEYEVTGGNSPVLVLLHGLAMGGSLWRGVVADLREDHSCIVPTLPLGGHRCPMHPDADLSILGMARLVAEFLEELDLNKVTLVGNDWGGEQLLVSERLDGRVGRLVLTSCEAFDNFPPGLPGRVVAQAAMPGGIHAAFQLLRLPLTWGWMSTRPVPDEVVDGWFRHLQTQAGIRRDLRKYTLSIPPKKVLLEWSERLHSYARPTLVVWAKEDRVMPREHGRRLAELFPQGRLLEIPDSYTLIPEDQPGSLAHAIREFVRDTPGACPRLARFSASLGLTQALRP